MTRAAWIATMVGVCSMMSSASLGQCGSWDNRFGVAGGELSGVARASVRWDPDGAGPMVPRLAVAGDFITAGGQKVDRVALWNGTSWEALGGGVGGRVVALTTWDPDGDGPLNRRLVAGGQFATASGTPASNIAMWDGVAWQPLGSGTNNSVNALAAWDPDGPGPATELLAAGGNFTSAGGVTVDRIALWNGASWAALPSVGISIISAITSYDPDGAGPVNPELVVGGGPFFSGLLSFGLLRWNGTQWRVFEPGLSNDSTGVALLREWDVDGAGPLPPQLVVAGSFTTAGGTTVNRIARWDGSRWLAFGDGFNTTPRALAVWDRDGDGPEPSRLVAAGSMTRSGALAIPTVVWWDGTRWSPIGSDEFATPPGFPGNAQVVATWDPDGPGPRQEIVVAGLDFASTVSASTLTIGSWDDGRWRSFGDGLWPLVPTMTLVDPDGDGPLAEQIVAAGIARVKGDLVPSVVRWDGSGWIEFAPGAGRVGTVESVMTLDPDGVGPSQPQLVVAGRLENVGGGTTNAIARWDGSAWRRYGNGFAGPVAAMTPWDRDGAGPEVGGLAAAIRVSVESGSSSESFVVVARWDGTQWLQVGAPFRPSSDDRYVLTSWDPDGDGPSTPWLIVGGFLRFSATEPSRGVMRWDGTEWVDLSGSAVFGVRAFGVWDPDGPSGPANSQLVAAGGVASTAVVVRFDGTTWTPLGSSAPDNVRRLGTWDPDGDGPELPQVVAVGGFTTVGGVALNRVARFDGTAWQAFGAGVGDGVATGFVTWDPDASGPLPSQPVVAGAFTRAGGALAANIAMWHTAGPEVVNQPTDTTVGLGAPAVLSVLARGGEVSYRWRKDGVPMSDGRLASGALVIGSGTRSLIVADTTLAETGFYDCVVTTPCGSVTSVDARLVVAGPCPCPIDYDGSGSDVPDVSDVAAFLRDWNEGDATTADGDPSADVDCTGEGSVPDIEDMVRFFAVFTGGCP